MRGQLARLEEGFDRALARRIADPQARRAEARRRLAAYLGLRVLAKAGLPEQALRDVQRAALNSR